MEFQQQQLASGGDNNSPETMAALETTPLTIPPPGPQPNELQRIGTQIANWLAQLPDLLSQIFNEYKQPIVSVALILAAIITLRVVLAVLVALNGIPLVAPTFKLVGVVYSSWFVNRYLLKASTRQELFQEIQGFLDK